MLKSDPLQSDPSAQVLRGSVPVVLNLKRGDPDKSQYLIAARAQTQLRWQLQSLQIVGSTCEDCRVRLQRCSMTTWRQLQLWQRANGGGLLWV